DCLFRVRRVIGVAADDAGDNFSGRAAFAFEMQRRQRSGSAQNLIGLIVERDGLSISPNAPQLERLDVTAPKSKKIKLRLASGKIDRDRFGWATAFPTDAGHTDVG